MSSAFQKAANVGMSCVLRLATEFRGTAYALLGHGSNARLATGYTFAVMAEDFQKLHAALGLKPRASASLHSVVPASCIGSRVLRTESGTLSSVGRRT